MENAPTSIELRARAKPIRAIGRVDRVQSVGTSACNRSGRPRAIGRDVLGDGVPSAGRWPRN
ncbi:hypothetical protein EA473_00410 [Natrarchaeobius chitinivorans]|uniref:Uncharacterized protein n=1 Tax=Natrarchaeobius chitinivorans TaxID=1679083 RepID=A0A3N6M6B9_NATCH|nr:hypothetical protein EA473_00410 [Natrarchaeobius chitinivorans]